jgi:YHS domain-containing protein
VRGTQKFSYTWLGSDWYFANEEHRKLFSDNPISYAPQYGGHCADGVAGGEVYVNIEPDVWKIIDGKLYLSGSDALAIEAGSDVMAKAEANWPKLRADLVAR